MNNKQMKRNWIILSLLVFLIAGCSQKEETKEVAEKVVAVKTAKAEQINWVPSLDFSGTAFARKEANLGASLPGRLEKYYFDEGQRVEKGALIASLSAELLNQALAEYDAVLKDYERVERLEEKGSISTQNLDHLKAKLKASEARVMQYRKSAEIRAPFSGVIMEKLVEEGENFFFNINLEPGYSTSSGIVRLMQLDPVVVRIEVNEKDIASVKKHSSAEIRFDAYPDSVFYGKVSKLTPMLSTMTRTAKVEIQIDNPDNSIMPGMYASVKMLLPETENVFVPMGAVYRQPGTANDYVFVVHGDIAKKKAIKRIYTINDMIAVEGLSGGEEVVSKGKSKLQDESRIIVKN